MATTKARRSALKLANLEKEANLPAELAAIASSQGMTPSKRGGMEGMGGRPPNKQTLALIFIVAFASLWTGE